MKKKIRRQKVKGATYEVIIHRTRREKDFHKFLILLFEETKRNVVNLSSKNAGINFHVNMRKIYIQITKIARRLDQNVSRYHQTLSELKLFLHNSNTFTQWCQLRAVSFGCYTTSPSIAQPFRSIRDVRYLNLSKTSRNFYCCH